MVFNGNVSKRSTLRTLIVLDNNFSRKPHFVICNANKPLRINIGSKNDIASHSQRLLQNQGLALKLNPLKQNSLLKPTAEH